MPSSKPSPFSANRLLCFCSVVKRESTGNACEGRLVVPPRSGRNQHGPLASPTSPICSHTQARLEDNSGTLLRAARCAYFFHILSHDLWHLRNLDSNIPHIPQGLFISYSFSSSHSLWIQGSAFFSFRWASSSIFRLDSSLQRHQFSFPAFWNASFSFSSYERIPAEALPSMHRHSQAWTDQASPLTHPL